MNELNLKVAKEIAATILMFASFGCIFLANTIEMTVLAKAICCISAVAILKIKWRPEKIRISIFFQSICLLCLVTFIALILRASLKDALEVTQLPFPDNAVKPVENIWTETSSILGAALEELIFRGVILFFFLKYLGKWKASLASTTLFVLAHESIYYLESWIFLLRVIEITGIGLLFCLIALKTRTLIYSVICHYLFNFFGAGGFDKYWDRLDYGQVIFALGLVGIFYLIKYIIEVRKDEDNFIYM